MSRQPSPCPKTRVYITVDVECAEERRCGSHVQPPLGYDLRVWGRFSNRTEDLGIPLVQRELDRCGIRATFFVEPFGSSYFGEASLRQVCETIRGAGHDVQLHAHPVQRRVDWYTRGEQPPPDDFASYGVGTQTALLKEGLAILERCGVPAGELGGFRAGHFGANNDTWAAMHAAGLVVSSNHNLCYLDKNCRIRWPGPVNTLFSPTRGVWELPISSFDDGGGRHRHLQVTAISFAEMRHFLDEAIRRKIPHVTIVTHPFEYFWADSIPGKRGRPNWINIRRLRQLCEYLRDHRDELSVHTIGSLAGELRAGEGSAAAPLELTPVAIPRGRRSLRYLRLAEQGLKRVLSQLKS